VYVYGVTAAGSAVRAAGIGDTPVSVVEHGELGAIVSRLDDVRVRAKRRDLLRHSDVLQTAFAAGPVIPLRFGTVFDSEGEVVDDLLGARYEELVGLLQQVEGVAELRVRAAFREEDLLAEIVRDDRRVAALRSSSAPPVEVGEAVARAVAARREATSAEVLAELGAHAADVRVDEPRDELEVIRASFLVDRGRVGAVERAAAAVADRHRARMTMELIGPMPPHSFVSLEQGAV
jgi:Gas vesicle synthesis protein GvpL/GvpF